MVYTIANTAVNGKNYPPSVKTLTEIIESERDQRRRFDKTEEGIYVARLLLQKVIGFFSELRCSSRRLALNTSGKALMWRFGNFRDSACEKEM